MTVIRSPLYSPLRSPLRSPLTLLKGGGGAPAWLPRPEPVLYANFTDDLYWSAGAEVEAFPALTGLADTVGSVGIGFTTQASAFSARQVLVSSADEGVANEWFEIGLTAEGKPYVEFNDAGTAHTVVGSTYLELSTAYLLFVAHDGADYFVRLGTVEQNPLIIESIGTFGWFGDVAGSDNLEVGKTVTSAGDQRVFGGTVQALAIWSEDITQ